MIKGSLGRSWNVNFLISWRFFVTFLGWLSDPFKGLSDLQLGDEKVTLNHLVGVYSKGCFLCYYEGIPSKISP